MLIAIFMTIGLGGGTPAAPGPYLQDSLQSEADSERRLAHDATVVGFATGETTLSETAMNVLRNLVAAARAAGPLRIAYVAAWSDREFKQASLADFPESGRKLAAERAERVADFLRDELGVRVVTTYNLADGSTRLDKAFDTADAELKEILSGERAPQAGQHLELRLFRDLGRASSAVVVIEHRRGAGTAGH